MTDSALSSSAAKKLSKLGASKGGTARANTLTPEERSEIARKAVAARWAKAGKVPKAKAVEQVSPAGNVLEEKSNHKHDPDGLPIALFRGNLSIGAAQFVCYVLDNGKRVMAQREVVRALTGKVSGDLGTYLRPIAEYIAADEIEKQTENFSIPGTQFKGKGYEATLLLDVCDAFLRARDASVLPVGHEAARQAEIITRACAKVGIIALIDEATGYQAYRKKQDLQIKLQAFIAEEMQDWARMFQEEFWLELARLEGIHYSPRNRPLRWGKYVMMFVYDAIDGDVGKELRKKNPDPHFLQNHHQWLKQFGRDKVTLQIERVITIMKLCNNMDDFRHSFAKVFQKSPLQMRFEDINWGSAA